MPAPHHAARSTRGPLMDFKALMVRIHSYWTVWLGYLMIALPLLHANWDTFAGILPPEWKPKLYPALGAAVVVMRIRRDIIAAMKSRGDPG